MISSQWASPETNALLLSGRPTATETGQLTTSSTEFPKITPHLHHSPPLTSCQVFKTFLNWINFELFSKMTQAPYLRSWPKSTRLHLSYTMYSFLHSDDHGEPWRVWAHPRGRRGRRRLVRRIRQLHVRRVVGWVARWGRDSDKSVGIGSHKQAGCPRFQQDRISTSLHGLWQKRRIGSQPPFRETSQRRHRAVISRAKCRIRRW